MIKVGDILTTGGGQMVVLAKDGDTLHCASVYQIPVDHVKTVYGNINDVTNPCPQCERNPIEDGDYLCRECR